MLRKRLIFVLIYSEGFFCQSRNFRLQKVGKVDWIIDNYKFSEVSKYIDECQNKAGGPEGGRECRFKGRGWDVGR